MKLKLATLVLTTMCAFAPPLALASDFTTQQPAYSLDDKLVLGRLENVYFSDIEGLSTIPFMAKIDTGADTTSIHADNIHVESSHPKYQGLKDLPLMKQIVDDLGALEEGSEWKMPFDTAPSRDIRGVVHFTLHHPYTDELIKVTRPLARMSVIRSRSSDEPMYRPVVSMPLTIAGHTVETDVNLTDRGHFSAPVLIGKSFLKQNAWVMAGYDYLQEQPKAQIVGDKERVNIGELELNASFSLVNRYSNLHAENIQIDKQAKQVEFELLSRNGERESMDLPLNRMLTVSGEERPLVYVPVTFNNDQPRHLLVYLTDRSDSKSQLRVGQESLSQFFMLDASNSGTDSNQSVAARMQKNPPVVISPQELLSVDGHRIMATPSLTTKTPLLKVTSLEVVEKKGRDEVRYTLLDSQGDQHSITKPLVKTLSVGGRSRPVVEGELTLAGEKAPQQFALEALASDDGEQAQFVIGKTMLEENVLINTRADHLLDAEPLFRAGYVENATVAGLTFPVKLDTGADVSSMNATQIKRFEQDGKPMVRFTYQNDLGHKKVLTREVVDEMRVKARKGEKSVPRPVVEMRVKLGDVEQVVRVNLQDRSRFHFSMILGKNFLKHGAVVSSDDEFLLEE